MSGLIKMSANQLNCHIARFEPHFCRVRRNRRSSALVITLVVLALVTILVIAFLGLASQDLKSTNFYVRSDQADQIARGGLDFIVGNLRGEMEDHNLSANAGTAQNPFYVPINGTNVFPVHMVPLGPASTNILLTSSSSAFYNIGQAPLTMGSAIPSTNISLNNQVITASDWNKPMLVPSAQAGNMPIPNWVFVSRVGPTNLSTSIVSSTVSPSLTNANGVIGRYAFVVYDTSGLLDINVAGYDSSQPSMATNAPGKGLLPYTDLTQLPGVTTNDVNTLVQFRNSVSETNYPMALTNSNGSGLLSNGFMQVYAPSAGGPSDTTFLSRQELIQYATNNPDWTNALPYLTTFSRELNGPTWGPTVNMGILNGTNYNYQTTATSASTATAATTYNPNIYAVKVPASWAGTGTTRNNGQPWIAGDPLVKYRFPLDKLSIFNKMATQALSAQDITDLQRYFGVDVAPDSSGYYRDLIYPTASSTYSHTIGQILSLAQVANLPTPREPDFFELLQAGILNGSLAGWGRGDNPPYDTGNAGIAEDFDSKITPQILRIGANIIDQWDTDSYPTTISWTSGGETINIYGISDLPYITQMFEKFYSPTATLKGPPNNLTMPVYPYVYFQVWNPYQAPSIYSSANPPSTSTTYPSQFRIVPYQNTSNAAYSDNVQFWIIATISTGTYKWAYDPTTGAWSSPGSPIYYFNSLPATAGGGLEAATQAGLNFTVSHPLTDYREPGVVIGTPNPAAPWTPTLPSGSGSPSGTPAAISLPTITAFPTNGTPDTSPVGKPTPATTNWNASTMGTSWKLAFQNQTTFVLQFKDSGGNWHTYGTFEGVDSQSVKSYTGVVGNQWLVPTSSSSTDDVSFAKTDPRTFRFGPGLVSQQINGSNAITNVPPNSANPPLLSPTSLAWYLWDEIPLNNNGAVTVSTPYRMDYWVANNQANPVQGLSYSANNSPYITDLDGVIRGGDSAYAYSGSANAWGSNPLLPGGSSPAAALPARPVMLHHPFNSVGDLGYAYRDDPFRSLDFMTPGSADAGLLDLFTLSEAPVVAGRINPNTPYPQIIQALVSGATQSSVSGVSGAVATVPSSTAQAIAQSLASFTSATPITNRASLVTSGAVSTIINSGAFTDSGTSKVKTEGESVVRALAESSNTRTWNFLIDVIGQSGHFINNSAPVSSGGKDNFVVEGERHYWLHIAIDRFTGQVVDQQLELVDQ
jgi:hypothetical protein